MVKKLLIINSKKDAVEVTALPVKKSFRKIRRFF